MAKGPHGKQGILVLMCFQQKKKKKKKKKTGNLNMPGLFTDDADDVFWAQPFCQRIQG